MTDEGDKPLIPRSWLPTIIGLLGIVSSIGVWITSQVIALDDRLDSLETAASKLIDPSSGKPLPSGLSERIGVELKGVEKAIEALEEEQGRLWQAIFRLDDKIR